MITRIAGMTAEALRRHCLAIADQVEPEYRNGKPRSCTGHYATRWKAAYSAAEFAFKEAEGLSLAAPGLHADRDAGEGTISFPEDWASWSGLLRADLLKGWIADLWQAHAEAMDAHHREGEAAARRGAQAPAANS